MLSALLLIFANILFIQSINSKSSENQLYSLNPNGQFLRDFHNLKQKDTQIGLQCAISLFHDLFTNRTQTYVVEDHTVTTTDGYVLRLFRVNLSDDEKANLPAEYKQNIGKIIHLQHGLTDSSDGYFTNGEANSPGFYLASKGFDIWAGNNRGNKYCHTHTNPHISEKDFFDFSWQEMGQHDVSAFVDYELNYTNQTSIRWIGHSEGTTQMFIALSDPTTRLTVTPKIEKYIAMAPIAYMKHCEQIDLQLLAKFNGLIYDASETFHVYDMQQATCTADQKYMDFRAHACQTQGVFCGNDENSPWKHNRKTESHSPSGCSAKCIEHYAQSINTNKNDELRYFNYGYIGNLLKYGSLNPPTWDMSKITADTVMIGALKDTLGDPSDVDALASEIPFGRQHLYWIANWEHSTFQSASDPTPLWQIFDTELGIVHPSGSERAAEAKSELIIQPRLE